MRRTLLILLGVFCFFLAVPALAASLEVEPESPRRGDAFRVRVLGAPGGPLEARFDERAFPLWPSGDGVWEGFVAVSRDAEPGVKLLKVYPADAAGGSSPVVTGAVTVADREFAVQRLTVKESMVTLSPENLERSARERTEILQTLALRVPEKHWSSPFDRPVPGQITSPFGLQRYFNDKPKSPHSGLDFAAQKGSPIRATTEGRVARVGDYFYTGHSVFLDHGYGIVTGYYHMDKVRVKEGDRVESGAVLGDAGSTGRSTGSHLHWSAYVSGVKVDPLSLIRLTGGRNSLDGRDGSP